MNSWGIQSIIKVPEVFPSNFILFNPPGLNINLCVLKDVSSLFLPPERAKDKGKDQFSGALDCSTQCTFLRGSLWVCFTHKPNFGMRIWNEYFGVEHTWASLQNLAQSCVNESFPVVMFFPMPLPTFCSTQWDSSPLLLPPWRFQLFLLPTAKSPSFFPAVVCLSAWLIVLAPEKLLRSLQTVLEGTKDCPHENKTRPVLQESGWVAIPHEHLWCFLLLWNAPPSQSLNSGTVWRNREPKENFSCGQSSLKSDFCKTWHTFSFILLGTRLLPCYCIFKMSKNWIIRIKLILILKRKGI